MTRKIDFPITARVIVVDADPVNSIRDIAAMACLLIEQRVNERGDIRIHVTLDETDMPKERKHIRYSEGDERDREAGFLFGDPVNYNPPCPDCHLCNALVPRSGMLVCRGCGYETKEADGV